MMTGISQRPGHDPVTSLIGSFSEKDNGKINANDTAEYQENQSQMQHSPEQQNQILQQQIQQQQQPIPKLGEILDDHVNPESVYSKINFLKFLVDKHCIENYEFYTELDSILKNHELFRRYSSTSEWFSIYDQFIETEIINLPADITLKLSKNSLPSLYLLNKIEKIIMNFLLASYYEFISYTKDMLSAKIRTSSSCSTSTTNSANNTASSCFTKPNSSLSPDSTSMCSDFSLYFLSESEGKSTPDDHEAEGCEFDVLGDINSKGFVVSTTKRVTKMGECICNGEDIDTDVDRTSRSRSATTSAGNRDVTVSTVLSVGSGADVSGNASHSYNDITLKSDVSSDSSVSNITVCERCDGRCESRPESNSWSRFTRKLKWRRRSES